MTGSYSWMHITDTFQTNYKVPETLSCLCVNNLKQLQCLPRYLWLCVCLHWNQLSQKAIELKGSEAGACKCFQWINTTELICWFRPSSVFAQYFFFILWNKMLTSLITVSGETCRVARCRVGGICLVILMSHCCQSGNSLARIVFTSRVCLFVCHHGKMCSSRHLLKQELPQRWFKALGRCLCLSLCICLWTVVQLFSSARKTQETQQVFNCSFNARRRLSLQTVRAHWS